MTIRILQVVDTMNRGGTETWLMQILHHIDRDRFHLDFLVNGAGVYDDEIRALGSKVICGSHPHHPLAYGDQLKRILRDDGPFDVVHSHLHHYSGYVLRLAAQAGVPMRIAHSHSDTVSFRSTSGLLRRTYLSLMESWIQRYATQGLAASRQAAIALFGETWQDDGRYRLLYCGIDLEPFQAPVDRGQVRAELGLPENAFVVGHVGRFVEVKNHQFFVDVAAEVARREPNACFLLVGDGPLRSQIEQKVDQLGLGDRFVFAGSRPDVPHLMKGAMDVFVFPSIYEGLGIVLLEAQAAGLSCVFTDTIPEEVVVCEDRMRTARLGDPASVWAEIVMSMRATVQPAHENWQSLSNTPFNIERSCLELERVYCVQPTHS